MTLSGSMVYGLGDTYEYDTHVMTLSGSMVYVFGDTRDMAHT